MSAEKIIKTLIEAASAVTAIVGSRCYADYRPEGAALPALIWSQISDVPEPPIGSATGYEPTACRVQVTCYASASSALRTLVEEVRKACHLQHDSIGGFTTLSVLHDNTGPVFADLPEQSFEQGIDFIVRYLR